jgi:phosphopantothenoylcysteine decarboxylase/phosphopantothenate--cysteine ligase
LRLLTLSVLSENAVLSEPYDYETGSWNSHVELGNQADLYLLAPLSANSLAKMAGGIADNLLLTTYLAAKCPVYFAPAMDLDMFKHPSTQKNIKILQSYGNHLIAPNEGELASGLCGAGRMEEPEIIFEIIINFFKKKTPLSNKKVLVSAGPTYEAIDPVRFIGNHSSGLMGYSIAEELANRGAIVELVSGPTSLSVSSPNIKKTDVVSAEEMYNSCIKKFPKCDIAVMSAAVADYTPEKVENSKIKKKTTDFSLKLKPTKDILAQLGNQKNDDQILIGFALETDSEINNAKKKLKNKNLDFIVLNSLKDKGAGFKHKTNKISIIDKKGNTSNFNLKDKSQVAIDIVDKIAELAK